MKQLSLAISPCPNDVFIFYALIRNKVNVKDIEFDVHFRDIEELNLGAINQQFDLCKISYALVPEIAKSYTILTAGSALGKGCGPLIISPHQTPFELQPRHSVVLPGIHTTASALFSHFYPQMKNTSHQLFSTIEPALQRHEFDAGVVIHESRFTYRDKGLSLIADLGDLWENRYHIPIPLGGIIIRKAIDQGIQHQINEAIVKSIEFAWKNQDEALAFCKVHAQETDPDVMMDHIRLYVNDYSLNIGEVGKSAIRKLFKAHQNENSCNFASDLEFID
jgi:1,4-dihydroxy-6-naphthoate synthase